MAADGSLYVTEIGAGQIRHIAPDGGLSVFATPGGGPNGAARGPDGALYVTNNGGFAWHNGLPVGPAADYETGRIERIEPDGTVRGCIPSVTGRGSAPPTIWSLMTREFLLTDPIQRDPARREPLNRPTARPGRVYYASPDGGFIRRVAGPLQHPNGIGISPDGRTLLVAETFAAGLCAFPILGPGQLGERRPFGSLPSGYHPDGFCVDEDGYVLVCGVLGGGIVVFDPDGRQVDVLPVRTRRHQHRVWRTGLHHAIHHRVGPGPGGDPSLATPGLVLFPDRTA